MNAEDRDHDALSRIAHEWRERMDARDSTEADREAFDAWIAEDIRHEEAFDRAETYWAAYDHLRREDIEADLMPQAERSVLAQVLGQIKAVFAPIAMKCAAAAVAMGIVALPVVFVLLQTGPTLALVRHETGIAETTLITLSDGTVATLGASTQIEIVMSDDARTITLKSGAAFFDVQPDSSRPFSVEAGDLTATALGTEFDVRSNGGVFRVAVAEGRVEVAYPHVTADRPTRLMKRRTLNQGQEVAATTDEGLRVTRSVAASDVGAWRNHRLVYDGGTLGELVADANRYSERDIVLADSVHALADQTITASFDANNINRMLSMLALSYSIEIDDSEPGILRLHAKDEASR